MFLSSGHWRYLTRSTTPASRIYELPATPEKIKAGLEIVAAGGTVNPPEPYYMGSDFWDEVDDVIAHPVTPRVMEGPPT
jgi:aldehyde oxidoreductase